MAFTLKGDVGWESNPVCPDNFSLCNRPPLKCLLDQEKVFIFFISEKSVGLNPRHSGGKPNHCRLSYRTHDDNMYINTTTYNSMVFGREKNLKMVEE